MRQAGYIPAAGLYALEHHIPMLKQDHLHAKLIAEALLRRNFVGHMLPVETNIIIFEITDSFTAVGFCDELRKYDILCLPISATQVRMVTHLDVNPEMVTRLVTLLDNM